VDSGASRVRPRPGAAGQQGHQGPHRCRARLRLRRDTTPQGAAGPGLELKRVITGRNMAPPWGKARLSRDLPYRPCALRKYGIHSFQEKYWNYADGLRRPVSAFSTSTGVCSAPLVSTSRPAARSPPQPFSVGERECQVDSSPGMKSQPSGI
jgi:hypothetical protein